MFCCCNVVSYDVIFIVINLKKVLHVKLPDMQLIVLKGLMFSPQFKIARLHNSSYLHTILPAKSCSVAEVARFTVTLHTE